MPAVPFELNRDRRHRIPRQKHKVTNGREYDASLRQRGSLTVRFTDEAIAAWRAAPRTTRGGQPWYSPLAILTALTLRAVFRLALRQTEGLIGSVLRLLGLELAVPDHTTLMWTATESQAGFGSAPAPCGASRANRRFAPGVRACSSGRASAEEGRVRAGHPRNYSRQPRLPSGIAGRRR
jgi:Transposase DDE domain